MRKLKTLFALLVLSFFTIGNVWGTETLLYTLDGTVTATGNAYATASDVTQSSKAWKVVANTEQSPWRIGGKSITNTDRDIYSTFAFDKDITKVEISSGATASSLTLNFIALIVSTAQNGGGTITHKDTIKSNLTEDTITFLRPDGQDWSDKYFKIVYNVTRTSSSGNGYVTFNFAKFYYEESGSTPSLSASPTTINFGTVYKDADVDDQTVEVTFLTGSVTYSGLEGTVFDATGSISSTGDEITISADASTIGEYEETLTIESTDDSKSVDVTITMNVVAAPEPTGTFELYSGDIEEGDYVIYYNGYAMDTTVSSSRLQYKTVTPSDNKIVNPDEAIIWHIVPISKSSYWAIYNAKANKYAAATGSKNQAQLLADTTDSKAKWTVTGSSTYEFENLARKNAASDSGNKWLRNNGNNGFACYASGTGGALSLYRKNAPSVSAVTNEGNSCSVGRTVSWRCRSDLGCIHYFWPELQKDGCCSITAYSYRS